LADLFTDGNTRVSFVPAIANIAAPTTAELNAGTLLQSTITSDGLMGFEAATGQVDNTALNSTFNTNVPGRAAFSGTGLRLKKQTATDTIFNLLTYGTAGFIVIRRSVLETTAWTAAQKVEVFPIICGYEKRLPPESGENSVEKYEIPTPVSSQPQLRATVA
jgi:hypothetical protein